MIQLLPHGGALRHLTWLPTIVTPAPDHPSPTALPTQVRRVLEATEVVGVDDEERVDESSRGEAGGREAAKRAGRMLMLQHQTAARRASVPH